MAETVRYAKRFGLVYFLLAIVVGIAAGTTINLLGGGSHRSSPWSQWEPTAPPDLRPKEIANRVASAYRLRAEVLVARRGGTVEGALPLLRLRGPLGALFSSVAYLDGTFFDAAELPGRDMREIPHPFIVESLSRFASLTAAERTRIRFIHLNHTNRAGIAGTAERKRVEAAGCGVAAAGERTAL